MIHGRLLLAAALSAWWACSLETPSADRWHQTDLWLRAKTVAKQYAVPDGRAVRALHGWSGQEVVLPLDLGREPRLSFRPVVRPGGACVFRVALRDPGDSSHQVFYEKAHRIRAALPRLVEVDLSAWSGRLAEIVLRVDGADCSAYWASPVVADLRPAPPVRGRASSPERPNVLLIAADTLRADALGAYGQSPTVTPALDRFAERSDVWLEAFSSINNTNPSFASLMTGLYPKNHRVFGLSTPLPPAHETLAERLQAAGYDTHAVVSVAHLGRSGLVDGFDRFVKPDHQYFAETVVDAGIDWLQEGEQGGESPFFLWLHLFDPHGPHTPPHPYDEGLRPKRPSGMAAVEEWEAFRDPAVRPTARNRMGVPLPSPDTYRAEVAYLDRQLDRLLGFVESSGLLENTLIVFVADHGEGLGEREIFYQHLGLHDEVTHVPLVLRWPGQTEGRRLQGLVQHFDLFPTVLGAVGLEVPEQDGIDLGGVGAEGVGREAVFANHSNNRGAMVRTPRYLYVVNRKTPPLVDGPHLYDLENDPAATEDLAGQGRAEEAALAAVLMRWQRDRRASPEPVRVDLSPEAREQLRALGYAEDE